MTPLCHSERSEESQSGCLDEIPRLASLARNDNGQLRSLGMTGGSLATRENRDLLARRTSRAYGSRPPRNRALPSPLAPRPSTLDAPPSPLRPMPDDLGLDQPITRRDFLNAAAVGAGAALLAGASPASLLVEQAARQGRPH